MRKDLNFFDSTLWKHRNQLLMAIYINIPMMSFGLATGWVSGESGQLDESGKLVGIDQELPWAAAGTLVVALIATPLSQRLLNSGRKTALLATSAAYVMCWSLKLVCSSGWWLICARCAAGVGAAGAWSTAPVFLREVSGERLRGAMVAAAVPAQNLGCLLAYVASDTLDPRTILWLYLSVSLCHCVLFALFAPESPVHLASTHRSEEARSVLSWLRDEPIDSDVLDAEIKNLELAAPLSTASGSLYKPLTLVRRNALVICIVAAIGEELCGTFSLLHYAGTLLSTSGAIWIGVAQLFSSCGALWLIEHAGRRLLLAGSAFLVAVSLIVAAMGLWLRWLWLPTVALCAAVAADSAGLQTVPSVLVAEMFPYQYRACMSSWMTAVSCAASAIQLALFPMLCSELGVPISLLLVAGSALLLTAYVMVTLPETKNDVTITLTRESPSRIV